MRPVNLLAVLGLPVAVFAQLSDYKAAISSIEDEIKVFAGAVTAYTGGDGADIQSDSDALVTLIQDKISYVDSLKSLDFVDSASLGTFVLDLITLLNSTVDDLVSKKSVFAENCLGKTIYKEIEQRYSVAVQLAAAINSKVDTEVISIASSFSSDIASALQSGMSVFSTLTGCTTTTSGSTSATAPASAPATPAVSTPTATAVSTSQGTSSGSPIGTETVVGTTSNTPTPSASSIGSATSVSTGAAAVQSMGFVSAGVLVLLAVIFI